MASAVAAAQELAGESGDDNVSIDQIATLDEEVQPEVSEIVEEDIMDEPVAADIEIPEAEFAAEDDSDDSFAAEVEEDTEASIRSMMARLEAAALEAKFGTADDAEASSALEEAEQVA